MTYIACKRRVRHRFVFSNDPTSKQYHHPNLARVDLFPLVDHNPKPWLRLKSGFLPTASRREICDFYSCKITEFTQSFDDLEDWGDGMTWPVLILISFCWSLIVRLEIGVEM